MHAHCASGCCGGHAAWPCPCPTGGTERLPTAASLLDCFLQTQGALAAETDYYSGLDSATAALSEALQALTDSDGLRPEHTPLPEADLKHLEQTLQLDDATLATCDDFKQLLQLLQNEAGSLSAMAAYDTALRVGMQAGIAPVEVFIHSGNIATLKAFGVDPPPSGWLDPSLLPSALRLLGAAEIERCLTICGNQWQRLGL